MTFTQRLTDRIARIDSRLCVGIDPRPDLIDGSLQNFLDQVVDETAAVAAAFKPNMAYFEALGLEGWQQLDRMLKRIPEEVPVILDAKRSDIPETQRYYAKAYFEQWNVDAVTLNGYLGFDSLVPFLEYEGKGIYLLGVTSNPGAQDVELQTLADGRQVFQQVQDMAGRAQAEQLPGAVGLVVGLTNVSQDVLARVEDRPLLVPGFGAQGGDLADLSVGSRKAPILINASRSILYGTAAPSAGERAEMSRQAIQTAFATAG